MKLVTLVLAVAGVAATAPAVAVADTIVIEAFSGARPDDADQWLAPVHLELARRGAVGGAALVERFERHVSRAMRALDDDRLTAARADAGRAYEALVDGSYDVARGAAERALDALRGTPWQLAQDATLRDAQFTALVVLARAHEVLGNHEAAFAAAAELYRTFPERDVSTRQFDPRVKELHTRVRERLAGRRSGRIEVRVDDIATSVYVNERLVGRGTVTVGDLAPGTYRVFTTRGADIGRIRDVAVAENDTASLELRWEIEAGIHTTGDRVTLRCEGGVLTGREIALVRDLARWLSADEVVVMGVRRVDARRSLVAYTVSVTPPRARYAALPVEPFAPDEPALLRFASLLVDDEVDAAGVALSEPATRPSGASADAASPPPTVATPAPGDRARWPYVLGGLGAAAGTIGVPVLWTSDELVQRSNRIASHADRDRMRSRARAMRRGGAAMSAIGGVLVGVALYGLLRDRDDPADESGRGVTGITVDRQTFWVTGQF
jgi:hypothetical protein